MEKRREGKGKRKERLIEDIRTKDKLVRDRIMSFSLLFFPLGLALLSFFLSFLSSTFILSGDRMTGIKSGKFFSQCQDNSMLEVVDTRLDDRGSRTRSLSQHTHTHTYS